MRKHPPALVQGALTGRVYIVTRYRWQDTGNGTVMVALEKFDVTSQFLDIDYAKAEDALGDDLKLGYRELRDG